MKVGKYISVDIYCSCTWSYVDANDPGYTGVLFVHSPGYTGLLCIHNARVSLCPHILLYSHSACREFTPTDTETDAGTETDADTDQWTQNPMWICVCLCVVWTPLHNFIQPIFISLCVLQCEHTVFAISQFKLFFWRYSHWRKCESCQNGRHNEPLPVLPGKELNQSSPKLKTMVVKTINCHHFICLFYQACAISAWHCLFWRLVCQCREVMTP